MSTQHIPIPLGPLSVSTVTTSCGICHKIGPLPKRHHDGRECYACVYVDYPGGGPVDEAMLRAAHMFAAAPDMYEALKHEAEWHEAQARTHKILRQRNPGMVYDGLKEAWHRERADALRAVLAKAEGKS